MINVSIQKKHAYLFAAFIVAAALLLPAGAWAAHSFSDVPDSNIFHDDIEWLADTGVTLGCGDGKFCPGDSVTREQMAAFMRRLSTNQVVDAKEVYGGTAWMWAQTTSPTLDAPITADATYAYNSEGAAITYTRTAVGRYVVTFPGWGTIGHSQVSTYASAGVNCQNSGWGGGTVRVACYDSTGSLADGRFTVLLMGN